jgi:hypothetical protein
VCDSDASSFAAKCGNDPNGLVWRRAWASLRATGGRWLFSSFQNWSSLANEQPTDGTARFEAKIRRVVVQHYRQRAAA